jgi:uncharacterized protein (DUF1499 family)
MKRLTLACLPFLSACAGEPPQDIGILAGRLADCPDSPNCVSSFETRESHYIEPITANLAAVQQALLGLANVNIVKVESNYLYAEFTSSLIGFVDDVEFFYDSTADIIHVRSASRVGYSDMGVNRKRIESIRSVLDL